MTITISAEQTLMTRDYCGNHIYRNGVLERVLNDAGYYPYGMPHGTGLVASVQPYKYTGKELDRETGLDWYDSQARMYDPATGHTTTMDPLAEKYTPMSPYLWCGGNPICNIDKNGMDWIKGNNEEVLWDWDAISSETTPNGYEYIGKYYKDLTVKMYELHTDNINLVGSYIIIEYSGSNLKRGYNWVQNIIESDENGNTNQYIDPKETDLLYYNDHDFLTNQITQGGRALQDAPGRDINDNTESWTAESTLVKCNDGEAIIPIVTISYGFHKENGEYVIDSLKIKAQMSQFQYNKIKTYNEKYK